MHSFRLFWKLMLAQLAPCAILAPPLAAVLWRLTEGRRSIFAVSALVLLVTALGLAGAGLCWVFLRRDWRRVDELAKAVDSFDQDDKSVSIVVDRRSPAAPLALAIQRFVRRYRLQLDRLAAENRRLATVLDGMEEGVLALDGERRILLANNAGRRLLQTAGECLVGRPLVEAVRSREVHAAVEDAFRRDGAYETEFKTTAAPHRHLHIRATRIPGDPSPGVVLVLTDISKLRRLETVRTEFAANVSHELKTPLASIKAYAETLRMGAVNDPEHNVAFVARIEEHADRLHYLIADLMHLARIESGKEAFEIVDIPIGELVEECIEYHREWADAKSIAVHLAPPPAALNVRGDEVAVRTILDNLLNNAIKYTPEGGRVDVAWRRDGQHAMVEVRDTGIGIAPENQDRVFERFFRVDQARSRELGGTGLGLSIVKHTAQALGGRVGLESRLGQGSTFRVWLPAAKRENAN
jgi:two-component system phosphate regulon sensor histidine kinase PhoR